MLAFFIDDATAFVLKFGNYSICCAQTFFVLAYIAHDLYGGTQFIEDEFRYANRLKSLKYSLNSPLCIVPYKEKCPNPPLPPSLTY